MAKRIRTDPELKSPFGGKPLGTFESPDIALPFYGPTEGTEVMLTQEDSRQLSHCFDIEILTDMPRS